MVDENICLVLPQVLLERFKLTQVSKENKAARNCILNLSTFFIYWVIVQFHLIFWVENRYRWDIETRMAVIALHTYRNKNSEHFELLWFLWITKVFVYSIINRFNKLSSPSDWYLVAQNKVYNWKSKYFASHAQHSCSANVAYYLAKSASSELSHVKY